jgi:uncharacterized protein YidB (DUF937 family)
MILRIVKWLFRSIAGRAFRGLGGTGLSSIVNSLIGQDGTGLPALLQKFTTGGLGDLVQSWVGKGSNRRLSADQVQSVLGSDAVSGLAGQLGTSPDAAAAKVAGVLPRLIDKLTPDGSVPDSTTLAQRLAELLKR